MIKKKEGMKDQKNLGPNLNIFPAVTPRDFIRRRLSPVADEILHHNPGHRQPKNRRQVG